MPSKSLLVAWYVDAFVALLLFTLGFYLCAQTAANPWATDLLASVGFFVVGVMLFVGCWRVNGAELGAFGYMKETYIVPKDDADFCAPGTIPALMAGTFQALGQISLFLGFYFFQSSIGVMTCIISGTSLLSATLGYFLYKEVLTFSQITGMLGCTGGLAYLAILGTMHTSLETVLCGVATVLFLSLRSLMAREAELEGMHPFTFTALVCLVSSLLALLLWAVLLVVGVDIWGGSENLHFAVIGGIAMALGFLFLVQAIVGGFTGPSISIANLTSVLVLILEHQAKDILPEPMKIYAIVIALSGVLFMTFGDELLWLFGFNCLVGRNVLEVEEQVDEVPVEMREELMKAEDRID